MATCIHHTHTHRKDSIPPNQKDRHLLPYRIVGNKLMNQYSPSIKCAIWATKINIFFFYLLHCAIMSQISNSGLHRLIRWSFQSTKNLRLISVLWHKVVSYMLTFLTNILPPFSLTLKMEAAGSYETVLTYDTTWYHSLDDYNLKNYWKMV
jgi:hypothetical protein